MNTRVRSEAMTFAYQKMRGVRQALPGALIANGGYPTDSSIGTHSRALIGTIFARNELSVK